MSYTWHYHLNLACLIPDTVASLLGLAKNLKLLKRGGWVHKRPVGEELMAEAGLYNLQVGDLGGQRGGGWGHHLHDEEEDEEGPAQQQQQQTVHPASPATTPQQLERAGLADPDPGESVWCVRIRYGFRKRRERKKIGTGIDFKKIFFNISNLSTARENNFFYSILRFFWLV